MHATDLSKTDNIPSARRWSSKTGFTLVELLVVIAIIGILIGMLLPAAQQVREAARRAVCQNNLAQLGIAIHNYEFSMEHLPPGVVNNGGPIRTEEKGQHVGFLVQLLPYIEQKGIAKNFDIAAGTYAAVNAPARAMRIPVFECPSFNFSMNDAQTAGITNYAGCNNGSEKPIDVKNNGLLFLNSNVTYGDIFDGSTNTILVGEMAPMKDTLGWASGTRASLRNCSELIDEKQWQELIQAPAPPVLEVGGFGSHHPGVVSVCMAGGAVISLWNAIDLTVFDHLGNRSDGEMMGDFQ